MVEIRLNQRPSDHTLYYEVLVSSQVRCVPQLKNKGILEFMKEPRERTRQKVGLLAGALAEDLCDRYSDTLDPGSCAKAAMDCLDELMSENPHVGWGDEAPRDADRAIAATVAKH